MTSWFSRDLEVGDSGPDVEVVQRRLGATVTGLFDAETVSYVRGLQRLKGLPVTGEVDERTADAIGEPARVGLLPTWYHRPLKRGDSGEDVAALARYLGENGPSYGPDLELAVRRFQSQHMIHPTGLFDEETAHKLVAG